MKFPAMTAKTAKALRKRAGFKMVYGSIRAGNTNTTDLARFVGVSRNFVNRVRQLFVWEQSSTRNPRPEI